MDHEPHSFHGRWLVELWAAGDTWGSPCAGRCLGLLLAGLGAAGKGAAGKGAPPTGKGAAGKGKEEGRGSAL